MSTRGRGGRRIVNVGGGQPNSGLSLNDRFSQLRTKPISPGNRAGRKAATVTRGSAARFAQMMQKRTGRRGALQGVTKTRRGAQTLFKTRRASRTFTGRGGRLNRGTRGVRRGTRGMRGMRGGKGGRKAVANPDSLDNDLDKYMGRSEKVQSSKLDDELEQYMNHRAETNMEEKKA